MKTVDNSFDKYRDRARVCSGLFAICSCGTFKVITHQLMRVSR